MVGIIYNASYKPQLIELLGTETRPTVRHRSRGRRFLSASRAQG